MVAVIGPSGFGKTALLRCKNFLENAGGGIANKSGVKISCIIWNEFQITTLEKDRVIIDNTISCVDKKEAGRSPHPPSFSARNPVK